MKSRKKYQIEHIEQAVCEVAQKPLEEITAKTRKWEKLKYRYILHYLAYHHSDMSLKEVGDMYGMKDHASVHHACSQVEIDKEIFRCRRIRTDLYNILVDVVKALTTYEKTGVI